MGMSTHVIGFKPADDKWKDMKAIWDACEKQGVPIPEQVEKFFEYEAPDDAGVQVNIYEAVKEYGADMEEGYEIDVTKLPKDVTIIRFYNSY